MAEPAPTTSGAAEPSERDAARVVARALGATAVDVRRFPTGLAHHVFDVRTDDGRALVVRLTRPGLRRLHDGCLRWHRVLRPRGVPLPALLAADDGVMVGFPVVVLERLPGRDLGDEYAALTGDERRAIAARVVQIQATVGSLPRGRGFGYATAPSEASPDATWSGSAAAPAAASPDSASPNGPLPLHPTWTAVLAGELARARRRIVAAGVVDPSLVDGVEALVGSHAAYVARVEPIPFLDDLTTKNVIVHRGTLSGVVDVDMVCYGDPLRTPALTRVALASLGYAADYVDHWLSLLAPSADQSRAFSIYVAMYCVDLLSEVGHRFNKTVPVAVDRDRLERLLALLRAASHL